MSEVNASVLVDQTRQPHPRPCGDCGREHLNGEHIRFDVPAPSANEMVANRTAWEGCVDCWVRRTSTNPDPAPVSRRTETTEG